MASAAANNESTTLPRNKAAAEDTQICPSAPSGRTPWHRLWAGQLVDWAFPHFYNDTISNWHCISNWRCIS